MTTLLVSVLTSTTFWTGSMTTVSFPKKCSQLKHHEQDQNVHLLDGYKNDRWFFELYAEDLLSLTREQFNDFRQQGRHHQMIGETSSAPPGGTMPMTILSGYMKGTYLLNPKLLSITSRRVPKEMHQHIPFLRMTSIMTPSRDPSWLLSKPKVFMMLLTQILILMMEISIINNSLKKNNLLYILYWLLLSRQTREEN